MDKLTTKQEKEEKRPPPMPPKSPYKTIRYTLDTHSIPIRYPKKWVLRNVLHKSPYKANE